MIENGFGWVAPIAERAAVAWNAACGLFADFTIVEAYGRSQAAE